METTVVSTGSSQKTPFTFRKKPPKKALHFFRLSFSLTAYVHWPRQYWLRTMKLAFASFPVEDEAAHWCCLPQSQTHSALQTLSLTYLDLKLRLTLGAIPAAEYPPLYGFSQCCASKKHPMECTALLPFYLKLSHPQAMLWAASAGKPPLGWCPASPQPAWGPPVWPGKMSWPHQSFIFQESEEVISTRWRHYIQRSQRSQDRDASVTCKSKQKWWVRGRS